MFALKEAGDGDGRIAARAAVHIILTGIPERLLYIGLIGGKNMGSDLGVMEFGIPTGIGGGYLHTSHVLLLLFGMAFSGIQTERERLQTRVDDNDQINYSTLQDSQSSTCLTHLSDSRNW
jgi:hypothetical protein